ncbi:ABC transporter permease [Scytonema hofmannii PCC 7110]|jgi:putative ABC transport system permease protein|uniref:ABC transporter permease n=1 Tax=Scytonema hofmannii PCC 7110 TaxID=128403 RepID=A0A139WZV5_9CYAN|nr:ABC transporter permease [Scytonema hofmannii PCC 7110]
MSIDFAENLNMAVRTLSANKLRSSLTMLGMIIGNASVIAIISVGQGAQQFVSQQFESLGSNMLFVIPGVAQDGPLSSAASSKSLVLADAIAIAREVPAVAGVAPETTENFRVTWTDRDTQVNVTGTTPQYPNVRNANVSIGRFFSDLELDQNHRVAVLGGETARSLFGTLDPLGKKIRIRNLSFRTIGVMAKKGAAMGANQDEVVFIPISVMVNQLTGQENSRTSPTVQSIAVSARNSKSMSAAQYQITNLLRLRHNIKGENDFTVRSQQDLLKTVNSITGMLVILLAATAGISLLVGGIGIMNIMLVSVTERTHEIGLRKAIGATSTDVLIQFAVEAVILSLVGGSFGILLGLVGTVILATLTPLEAVISPIAIILAVGVSGVIGLGFGVVPARNAARLEPIVALRS